MSKYTTEVRNICESLIGNNELHDGADVLEIIGKSYNKIFWDSIDLFDENYKAVLFPKILLHYYTREIGYETYGLWKLKLNTKLVEIMPYYNELYRSAELEFNPFDDVKIHKEHSGTSNGTSQNNSSGNTNSSANVVDKYSETPQGGLKDVIDGRYLTSAKINDATSKTNTESKSNSIIGNTDKYIEDITGKQGSQSYSKLLKEYRSTIINIDMMIIEELNDLFMNIW